MLNRNSRHPMRSRALLSVAINAALALGWNAATATTHPVTNCNSSGTGSLSDVIADPMTADGDVIDMTPLKTVCSKITVDDIAIHKDVILQGPGAKYLTIDGGNNARLFHHDGMGTLAISGVTLANGANSSASSAKGGCLYSTGSVSLIDAEVSHCAAESSGDQALGGAVYTQGSLHLLRSRITDSHITGAPYAYSFGGGAYVKKDLTVLYSTVARNAAGSEANMTYGFGGGIVAGGNVDMENSTIAENRAVGEGGALFLGDSSHVATIVDSTISGNSAFSVGGVGSNSSLAISNSTIVFNRSLGVSTAGGVHSVAPVALSSSIIAGNANAYGASDLAGTAAATVTGSDNLVFASSLMLPMGNNNTTGICPQLDVLADNGGPTLTHGLKPTSPAIDKGSAAMSVTIDQRLEPRTAGMQTDIGAVEWKQGDKLEGVFVGGFDGLCDQ